ncbi:3-oxoacyl-(acyl-carrier-protein) synthase II [Chthonomonas calidirosea]|nr:beta-ketoacyl-ACP synthase II [Chthonomonas calidirosea]CEK14694.1 3-oxoacyl-(acyl-carrier-protein) synthase II [Chthonomonas calidirosea]
MQAQSHNQSVPRRVVITGIGAVTPLGHTAEDTWRACLSGCSGVGPITFFDASGYSTRIAAEIKDWDPSPYFESRKEARRVDRFVQFAVAASRMAIEDAKLEITPDNSERVGVYIGSGIGGLATLEEWHKTLLERGPDRITPFLIPAIICNMGAGMVSILTGARGPNSCITTACTTGLNNIGDAYELIKRGGADVVIAGGAEAAITPLGIAGFCAARTMSTRNEEPTRASRPFDAQRDGFVMGEGAGIVILEALDSALARSAKIYAEVVGYGMSGDAHHVTAPPDDGNGAIRCMRAALNEAGVKPEEVDYINAHGTSTELNDRIETLAIKAVFGEHAYRIPVSSTKSMTAHMVGAAGAVETIFCALAIRDRIVPPTINYEYPDPNCDLDYVPNKARPADVNIALSNSFGFGGHNGSILLKRYSH